MLIAQITDMHVKPRGELLLEQFDSYSALERAIERINRCSPLPDLLVATGDLAADGRPEEYAALHHLLDGARMPYLLIPGNHDDRGNLRDAFPGQPWEDGPFLLYAVDDWPLRIVALDTVVAGQPHGELCRGRCRWLDETLSQQPDRPTVVTMHHPPFATGIAHMDGMGLADPSGLAEIVAKHRQIVRILCGHIHRPIQTMFAGVATSVAPATSFQVELKLDDSKGIMLTKEPPAFQLHSWSTEGGLLSHTAYVEDFGALDRPGHSRRTVTKSGLADAGD
ncbi:MAG: phosphodiesterase [Alphaproteobacteria bacterium]|nr:phosphodiesterase [Alphaproteobacteria bacterium]